MIMNHENLEDLRSHQTIEYPNKSTTFHEAWFNPDHKEQKGWREEINKEFQDLMKHDVYRRIKHDQVPSDRWTIGSK